MPLDIPSGYANWHIKVNNVAGGLSATSSIAFATSNPAALDQTIVNRVSNLFRDGLKVLWDASWSVGPVHVQESVGAARKVWDDATTEAGTHTAQTYLPPAASYIVTKATGFAGRQARGRVYLPGVQDNVGEDGILDTTDQSDKQTAMNALLTAVNADAGITEIVLLHDSESPGALTPTPVTSLVVRSIIGTMRPRQRR